MLWCDLIKGFCYYQICNYSQTISRVKRFPSNFSQFKDREEKDLFPFVQRLVRLKNCHLLAIWERAGKTRQSNSRWCECCMSASWCRWNKVAIALFVITQCRYVYCLLIKYKIQFCSVYGLMGQWRKNQNWRKRKLIHPVMKVSKLYFAQITVTHAMPREATVNVQNLLHSAF